MFKKIKEFFVGKPASERNFAHPLDAVTTPAAPYKVEPPATHSYDVPPTQGMTTLEFIPPAVTAPEVVAEPAKKPRKPRTPKVAVVAEKPVKEKAPAKAKAPKLTVVKAEKKTKSQKA
jgi:hypothetical protein